MNWCAGHGLEFDAHNENVQELIDLYGNDCRKIGADEYWDDKAVRITFPRRLPMAEIIKGCTPDAEIVVNEKGGQEQDGVRFSPD